MLRLHYCQSHITKYYIVYDQWICNNVQQWSVEKTVCACKHRNILCTPEKNEFHLRKCDISISRSIYSNSITENSLSLWMRVTRFVQVGVWVNVLSLGCCQDDFAPSSLPLPPFPTRLLRPAVGTELRARCVYGKSYGLAASSLWGRGRWR